MIAYRQTTCETCLPVCLLSFLKRKIKQKSEISLLIGGIKRHRDSYAFGIVDEFCVKYKKRAIIFFDNKVFLKEVSSSKNSLIKLVYKKINHKFLDTAETPFILYLDTYILGNNYHYPHFVVVEKRKNNHFVLIDPWEGKRKKISVKKLEKGVSSLRSYLNFCPLVIKPASTPFFRGLQFKSVLKRTSKYPLNS